MAITSYIKEIGRGKEGARALSEAQAHDLMSQVLDGSVTDLEIGAFALAMRIKGESVAELTGFVRAAQERCITIAPARPTIVLPSYNGARKLPNLTPLLALLLAQEGAQVLVHGPMRDAGRVTTAEIFHDLGLPCARNAEEIENGWLRREPVFIAIDDLCPSLARLLAVRRVVGLRNSGHTVAKVLAPCTAGACLRVVNYTHPEYATMLGEFLAHTGGDAVLLRGTEGEPVADPRRAPKLEVFIAGQARADLSRPAHEGVLTELPVLPRGFDAATTAVYIQSVVSGEKPAPGPLTQQVECLIAALGAIDRNAPKEQIA
ncbi:MAG TPA: DNA-binding protein YbiB [Burkholderiaceae bacterium]|nr:DNA-binding protein YbiB [Burkholderiaceae bacterium]